MREHAAETAEVADALVRDNRRRDGTAAETTDGTRDNGCKDGTAAEATKSEMATA